MKPKVSRVCKLQFMGITAHEASKYAQDSDRPSAQQLLDDEWFDLKSKNKTG